MLRASESPDDGKSAAMTSHLELPIFLWTQPPLCPPTCITITADEKVIVTGSATGQLILWTLVTSAQQQQQPSPSPVLRSRVTGVLTPLALFTHTDYNAPITSVAVVLSSRGERILSASAQGRLAVWDLADGIFIDHIKLPLGAEAAASQAWDEDFHGAGATYGRGSLMDPLFSEAAARMSFASAYALEPAPAPAPASAAGGAEGAATVLQVVALPSLELALVWGPAMHEFWVVDPFLLRVINTVRLPEGERLLAAMLGTQVGTPVLLTYSSQHTLCYWALATLRGQVAPQPAFSYQLAHPAPPADLDEPLLPLAVPCPQPLSPTVIRGDFSAGFFGPAAPEVFRAETMRLVVSIPCPRPEAPWVAAHFMGSLLLLTTLHYGFQVYSMASFIRGGASDGADPFAAPSGRAPEPAAGTRSPSSGGAVARSGSGVFAAATGGTSTALVPPSGPQQPQGDPSRLLDAFAGPRGAAPSSLPVGVPGARGDAALGGEGAGPGLLADLSLSLNLSGSSANLLHPTGSIPSLPTAPSTGDLLTSGAPALGGASALVLPSASTATLAAATHNPCTTPTHPAAPGDSGLASTSLGAPLPAFLADKLPPGAAAAVAAATPPPPPFPFPFGAPQAQSGAPTSTSTTTSSSGGNNSSGSGSSGSGKPVVTHVVPYVLPRIVHTSMATVPPLSTQPLPPPRPPQQQQQQPPPTTAAAAASPLLAFSTIVQPSPRLLVGHPGSPAGSSVSSLGLPGASLSSLGGAEPASVGGAGPAGLPPGMSPAPLGRRPSTSALLPPGFLPTPRPDDLTPAPAGPPASEGGPEAQGPPLIALPNLAASGAPSAPAPPAAPSLQAIWDAFAASPSRPPPPPPPTRAAPEPPKAATPFTILAPPTIRTAPLPPPPPSPPPPPPPRCCRRPRC
ncbi:hypothetical protein PAPYR_9462 [Paratrimastix pyriformis]|uniref:Uncharacterized protein n=1 Tax=Paratrimastix pyriformis TaxID=342808 RepID=A0ABQ8UD25_9EUKA|nr:hypothetical protein PAPYR_9462 [Paratrimastix pyriformis]